MLYSCSTTKFVPDQEYLLHKVRIESDTKDVDAAQLSAYIRQQGNSKWFSLFKIPLAVYSLSSHDSTRWINRTLKNIGEEPVLYDSVQAQQTADDLRTALQNMGYMNADVSVKTAVKKKKVTVTYLLHPDKPFFIHHLHYDIPDDHIKDLLQVDPNFYVRLREGRRFSVNELDQERSRIVDRQWLLPFS